MTPPISPSPPERSVLWVEPYLEYRDPTARQLLHALPRLRAAGWQVKAWCLRSDAPRDEIDHTFLPAPWLPAVCGLFYFAFAANVYGLLRWLRGCPRPATIIHTSSGLYFGANIASVHFLNSIWVRKQWALGMRNFKEAVSFLGHCAGAILERVQWWSPALRLALPVSDSIREEVRRRAPAELALETLPNAYDETRFNRETRNRERERMRRELGIAPTDIVFSFVSLGHHHRKGFWLAVEALRLVRSDPALAHVRFLVVGGKEETLADLRLALDQRAPGWQQWLQFAGAQPRVEEYLAAADAFLYPSYFEAFCLAEIEAAAMGVPLLLTRHHGSEMILEEGVNGLWLEFDPQEIAAQIRRFLDKGPDAFRHSIGAALNRAEYAERLLRTYEQLAAALPRVPI